MDPRNLLSIQANFCSAVVSMVPILPLISASFGYFSRFLGDCSKGSNFSSTTFSVFWQDPGIRLAFHFPALSVYGPLRQQNPLDIIFFLLVN